MKALKLAIVGCGAIVENNHLPALRDCPEWQLECLVDANKERAERLAHKYNCQGVSDIAQIPEGVEAVLVAVPNHLHGDITRQFLRNGCHVLCEKPLTITSQEGEELRALSVKHQRRLVVGHQLRFLPTVQRLRNMLQTGQFGTIKSVDLAMGWASEWQSVTNFYQDCTLAGGGVMLDLGCHLLDLALYLFGNPTGVKFLCAEYALDTSSLEKAISVELAFGAGFKGILRVSRLTNLNNAISVYGDSGHAVASLVDTTLDVLLTSTPLCATGRGARIGLAVEDPFASLWHNFYLAIQGGDSAAPDLCSGAEGVRAVQLIEQIYREMRRHEP